MVVGIKAVGAYIPKHRLGKQTAGWGLNIEKAVANFDEDSITLAVAAGMDCLLGQDRSKIDSVYFATTTSPYVEKQCAAIIATALDLRHDIFTTDVTNTLRAGTAALRSALDAVKGGSSQYALVLAADTRLGLPRGDIERSTGDGAVALLLTKDRNEAIAEISDHSSIADFVLDQWRAEGDPYVRSWEERFALDEGYLRLMPQVVKTLLQRATLAPKDFAKAVFYSPDARRHADMGRALGFAPEQIQAPFFGQLGNTGAAFALMLLAAAFEDAKPADRLLLASYGDGADAFLLQVSEGIRRFQKEGQGRRGFKSSLAAKYILSSYEEYLKWRGLLETEPARRPALPPVSAPAALREQAANLSFHGARCTACNRIQYPPQRVCTFCHTIDKFEPVRLSDKKGTLYTYSLDYVAGTLDVPLVIAVMNFENGGRVLGTMTDREVEAIKIGMPLEMSFRKLHTINGIHNYFWKAVPVREVKPQTAPVPTEPVVAKRK